MAKIMVALATIVLLASSAVHAENIFDVISSTVKATADGIKKVVTGFNPGKVVSNTVDGSPEATRKMGEATLGGVTNTVGMLTEGAGKQ